MLFHEIPLDLVFVSSSMELLNSNAIPWNLPYDRTILHGIPCNNREHLVISKEFYGTVKYWYQSIS